MLDRRAARNTMKVIADKFNVASLVLLLSSSCWAQRIVTSTETKYRTVTSVVTLTSNVSSA